MTKYCPNCKIEVEAGKFCPECGSKLEDIQSELFCPECGKVYDHGKFCPECGVKLEERKKIEEALKTVSAPSSSQSTIECPACGFENPAGSTVCAGCGFPLDTVVGNNTVSSDSATLSEDEAILTKYSDAFGDIRELNEEEAPVSIEEIRRIAEKGNPKAETFLAYLYFDGKYIEQDYQKSYDLLCDAESKGYVLASAYKAMFYVNGIIVKQDLDEAERLIEPVLDIPPAMYSKGMICLSRDEEDEAVKWFKKAADSGDPDGLSYLGMAYLQGTAIPLDPVKAFECFNKSAALGNVEAENMLGVCYLNGEGTEPDEEQALYWFQEAAKHNDPNAQNNLAYAYKNGKLGLEADPEKAFELYKKAAEQDNVDAMFEVAEYYDASYLTAQKSVEWYQKAADAGHGDAMYALAQKYENGWHVEQNLAKAKEYYEKAAEAGCERAIQYLEENQEDDVTNLDDSAKDEERTSFSSSSYRYYPYSSGRIHNDDIFASMPGGNNLYSEDKNNSSIPKTIEFKNIWYEDVEGCFVIHAKFTIDHALNQNGRMHAWFNEMNGAKKMAPSWETVRRTPDGQLCVSDAITPTYESTLWNDFRLVIPFDDFDLQGSGDYKFKFQLGAVFGQEHLPYSNFIAFTIRVNKTLLHKKITIV
jgi:TPR repeat protein